MTLFLKFKTTDEEINKQSFEYNSSMIVRDMLNDFLLKTNSKKTLSTNEIAFMFGTKIINNKNFIDQPLSSIFKSKKNVAINVRDMNDVIGG